MNLDATTTTNTTTVALTEESVAEAVATEGASVVKPVVRSIQDKLVDVTLLEDGSLVHNTFKATDGQARKFKNEEVYKKWLVKHQRVIREHYKQKLTPNQFFITQGHGTERPFTGAYWWTKDAGTYSCACCSQRIFMSEHKYETPSGYATFWNHIVDTMTFRDDHLTLPKVTNAHVDTLLKNKEPIKRCVCSNVSDIILLTLLAIV